MRNSKSLLIIGIGLLGTLYFALCIGGYPLFDWDEINFAECSREMLESGNFWDVQLYYKPFWEKPPLFIWVEACSMKLFGVTEFAARFPNALCGGLTLGLMAFWSLHFYTKQFCATWIITLLGCMLPLLYFKSGIIDPWFNLYILVALFFAIVKPDRLKYLIASGLVLGLAVLTKGPVAFLLFYFSIAVFYILKKRLKYFISKAFLVLLLSSIVVPLAWILSAVLTDKTEVLYAFVDYQLRLFNTEDSGHGGSFLFHPLVLILGCFPASLLLFRSRIKLPVSESVSDFRLLMLVVTCVVLLIFGIVKTKIIHYSSLTYIPLSFLIADTLQRIQSKPYWLWNVLFFSVLTVLASGLFAISLFPLWKPYVVSWFKHYSFEWHVLGKTSSISPWLICSACAVLVSMVIYWYYINTVQISKLFKAGILLSVSLHVFICFSIPEIGYYSQSDLIELCKRYGAQGYIETRGFKSYAPLFYGKAPYRDFILPQRQHEISNIENQLQKSGLDPATHPGLVHQIWIEQNQNSVKPRFIICKRPTDSELQGLSNFLFIEHRGAYTVYRVK